MSARSLHAPAVVAAALLAAAAILPLGAGCGSGETAESSASAASEAAAQAPEEIRVVSLAEAEALRESDAPPLFLDVRTRTEFEAGHVPGALNIPHTELAEHLDDVLARRERLIVVYCESGGRAGMALEVLSDAGVEHLAELEGSMAAWREAGLPQEK